MYRAWWFWNWSRAALEIPPMLPPFVLPHFPAFFNKTNQSYKPVQNICTLSLILEERYQNKQPSIHPCQSYVDCTKYRNFNWKNEQGIRYPTALSLANLSQQSSLVSCLSLGKNTIFTVKKINYWYSYWSTISISKCDSLPFGHALTPFGIRRVIHLLGEITSQPPAPLQGMLQLQGLVALAISLDKFCQDQTYKYIEIIS